MTNEGATTETRDGPKEPFRFKDTVRKFPTYTKYTTYTWPVNGSNEILPEVLADMNDFIKPEDVPQRLRTALASMGPALKDVEDLIDRHKATLDLLAKPVLPGPVEQCCEICEKFQDLLESDYGVCEFNHLENGIWVPDLTKPDNCCENWQAKLPKPVGPVPEVVTECGCIDKAAILKELHNIPNDLDDSDRSVVLLRNAIKAGDFDRAACGPAPDPNQDPIRIRLEVQRILSTHFEQYLTLQVIHEAQKLYQSLKDLDIDIGRSKYLIIPDETIRAELRYGRGINPGCGDCYGYFNSPNNCKLCGVQPVTDAPDTPPLNGPPVSSRPALDKEVIIEQLIDIGKVIKTAVAVDAHRYVQTIINRAQNGAYDLPQKSEYEKNMYILLREYFNKERLLRDLERICLNCMTEEVHRDIKGIFDKVRKGAYDLKEGEDPEPQCEGPETGKISYLRPGDAVTVRVDPTGDIRTFRCISSKDKPALNKRDILKDLGVLEFLNEPAKQMQIHQMIREIDEGHYDQLEPVLTGVITGFKDARVSVRLDDGRTGDFRYPVKGNKQALDKNALLEVLRGWCVSKGPSLKRKEGYLIVITLIEGGTYDLPAADRSHKVCTESDPEKKCTPDTFTDVEPKPAQMKNWISTEADKMYLGWISDKRSFAQIWKAPDQRVNQPVPSSIPLDRTSILKIIDDILGDFDKRGRGEGALHPRNISASIMNSLIKRICYGVHDLRVPIKPTIDPEMIQSDLEDLKAYCFNELWGIDPLKHGGLIGSISRIQDKIILGEYVLPAGDTDKAPGNLEEGGGVA